MIKWLNARQAKYNKALEEVGQKGAYPPTMDVNASMFLSIGVVRRLHEFFQCPRITMEQVLHQLLTLIAVGHHLFLGIPLQAFCQA